MNDPALCGVVVVVAPDEHKDMIEARASSRAGERLQYGLSLRAPPFCSASFVVAVVNAPAGALKPGDLVVADSEGAILHIDSASGTKTVLSIGGSLVQPFGLAMDAHGNLLVSDTGSLSIVQIHPATGAQTVIAAGGQLGSPYGIAVDRRGNIFVANGQAIIRIDSARRTQQVISSKGAFLVPLGVAVAPTGDLFVADAAGLLFRVDPISGAQTLITSGGNLVNPMGIIFDAQGQMIVADCAAGKLIQVDAQTGAQTLLFSDRRLIGTVGMALDLNGKIILSNPDAFDLEGGIFRCEPEGGLLTSLMVGSGPYVNPRCIVMVRLSLLDQLCPCAGPGRPWKNRGEYMACLAKQTKELARAGVITEGESRGYLKHAAQSNCGR